MPELKVEVNAVPIEEINQSVTRLRKMAAPGIKTILELQAQKIRYLKFFAVFRKLIL